MIDHRLFVKRHADAADDGAKDLTACCFRIQNAPRATALRTRATRSMPSSSSSRTSANTAECA